MGCRNEAKAEAARKQVAKMASGPEPGVVGLDHPKKVTGNTRSSDPGAARRLWQVPEELTGVSYAWP
jgi:hypothetical protein